MRAGLGLICAAAILAGLPAVTAQQPPDSADVDVQLQLADLLWGEGRFREAIVAFDRATAAADPDRRIRAQKGVILCALRIADFPRAQEAGLALRAMAPGDAEAIAIHGNVMWASGDFDEAENAFRRAVAMKPESPYGRHGLARSLAARSQLDAALNEAMAALNASPRENEFHYTVGSIYERMHRFEEAAVAFGNYVNLLPNKDRSDKAAWARAEIRFLRSFGTRVPFRIEGDAGDILHTVPFRLVRDKVIVKGSVNGGSPIDLVLDTGAEQTVLSQRVAQRAGVAPVVYTLSAGVGEVGLRGLQVGRIDSLQIGTLRVENVPCIIKNPPLGGLPTREADSFSPLTLGLSMTIDYGRKLLTIGRKVAPETDAIELPLRLHRLAMVRGVVNGDQPVQFVVDTGGEVISLSMSTAITLPQVGAWRRIPLKVYGTSGWDPEAFLLPGVDLAFDTIRFTNFPVVVLNLRAPSALLGFQLGGIVGHRFLSKYRVGIDLEQSVLRLKVL